MKKLTKHEMALLASGQFSVLRAADRTVAPSDLRAADRTVAPSDLRAAFGDIPVIEKPYTSLLAAIRKQKRLFKQSTFSPETKPRDICNTPMCTAGHLVNMAGDAGWKLKQNWGFEIAATLIHDAAHPGWPPQSYGAIPDEWALAYIEEMAEHEQNGTKPEGYIDPAPSAADEMSRLQKADF